MATKDGLAQIWYADANGVITGYTPTADNVASAIIDAYNEHYGTVINIWTPETKTLQVGDTVPNWNAYEKIYMQGIKVKIQDGSNSFAFGEIINDKIILKMQDENKFFIANSNGEIYTVNSNAASWLHFVAIPQINSAGYNVSDYELQISQYQIGDVISDWSDYTLIPQS